MIPSLRISFSYFFIFSCLISKERDKLLTNKLLGRTLFFAVTQPNFWILSSYNTCTRFINSISGISISILSAENQLFFFQFSLRLRLGNIFGSAPTVISWKSYSFQWLTAIDTLYGRSKIFELVDAVHFLHR